MSTPLPKVDPLKELARRREARDAHLKEARYWKRRAAAGETGREKKRQPEDMLRKVRQSVRQARAANRSVLFYLTTLAKGE